MKSSVTGLVLCVLLGGATGALAEAPDTVFLEELTWTEIRDRIQGGATTVIVPIGGTKHNVRVKALSEKIARALGNALVAPVLAYVPEGQVSPPTGHMRFPGTLTVPDDVFQKNVEYAARSLKAHGFRHIVLLGDHGSTQSGQSAVATRLNREWASAPVRVHAVGEYYRASQDEFRQLLKARGYRDDELGSHAALADTSLMLAVDPRLVRMDRLRRGTGPTGDGVDGDPGRASAELGRLGVEAIVARTVSAVRTAIARP
jgi:creatinine amidohydrolase/Fe(II)-dependent formamide hydrolase-like protein